MNEKTEVQLPSTALCKNYCEQLTDVERSTLVMIANGHSTKGIAKRLGRAVKTVEATRSRIMDKLGAPNIVQCAAIAAKAGLV